MENKKEVIIKFDKKELDEAIDKAFDKNKDKIEISGFRKGKVPRDVYYKKHGKESLYMDAVDILLPTAYKKLFEENPNLRPVARPGVDLRSLSDQGVDFAFSIIEMPEVEIKKYKGLKVKKDEVKVSKEEVEHEIGHILERYAEYAIKDDGEVEESDIAIIDYEGFKDGVPFDGGKGENYSLTIGSHTFIPGFEEQLIGMKKSEERDINVTFPEDYHAEDLKGKDVIFKVKVNEIKQRVDRELDKELFDDLALDGVDSKESLEKEIEKQIRTSKEREADNTFVDSLLKEIAKNTKVDVPEECISDELDEMIKRFEEQLRMQGISLEVFYEMTKSNEEALKDQMREEATNRVIYRFILEKIKELENITVSDTEIDEEMDKVSKSYGMKKDEFLNAYGNKDMFKEELEIRKTIDFLKENN